MTLETLLAQIPSPPTNDIQIGPVRITFYGIALALGILAAFMLAGRRWERRGHDPDDLFRLGLWSVGAGILGARIAFLLPRLDVYLDRPASLFAIWEGGLSIFGGLIGGVLMAYLLARRWKLDVLDLFDAAAPAIPLAQAIGRWGNYFNQELFGRPTDLPWGLEIDPANRPPEFADAELFHPTFLYEMLWNLALVGLLLWLDRKRLLPKGSLFLVYIAGYAAGRFWIELLRVDTEFRLLGLSRNGWFSVLAFAAAVILFLLRQRGAARAEPAETPG